MRAQQLFSPKPRYTALQWQLGLLHGTQDLVTLEELHSPAL